MKTYKELLLDIGVIEEGRMKELHDYIEDGKSAKEIAKIMKLDVKTIEKLMQEGITDWEPGDGKPMTGGKISQLEYWELPNDELKKIVSTAKKSIKKKTNNDWKWKGNSKMKEVQPELNDIHDASEVLHWRKRNGQIVIN